MQLYQYVRGTQISTITHFILVGDRETVPLPLSSSGRPNNSNNIHQMNRRNTKFSYMHTGNSHKYENCKDSEATWCIYDILDNGEKVGGERGKRDNKY